MKTTLEATTLDQIAGGYVTGSLNDKNFKVSRNSDGTYQLNMDGQDPQTLSRQQVIDTMNSIGTQPLTDDQINEAFSAIDSDDDYDVGAWYTNS